MKAVYALITGFLLLCVFFSQWYLCQVRHLCALAANLEVLGMILLAFLIGIVGSWLINEKTFLFLREQMNGLRRERHGLESQVRLLEKENQDARRHVAEWQREVSLLAQVKKVTEPLLSEAKRQVSTLEQELQQVQRRYENLKNESDAIRTTAEKLKEELAKQKAQPVISPAIVTHSLPEKDRSRFTPSTTQTRNDLTKISGIGPAIQKKLNALGIYTFQQISELTPEMIDKIAASLKSFPDRIGRDNWIGQAAALARHKK
ncbi:MAG: hypothetical protein U0289_01380 [Cyclobacteriaceae bacterium]